MFAAYALEYPWRALSDRVVSASSDKYSRWHDRQPECKRRQLMKTNHCLAIFNYNAIFLGGNSSCTLRSVNK